MTRYIDIKAVHRLIGSHYPNGGKSLVQALEAYLTHVTASGERLADQLLAHNLSGKRNRSLSEVASIDADLVFTFDVAAGTLNRELKDYRVHQEFSRAKEERRVVLHLWLKYPDRTQWAIHVPLQALMKGFGDTAFLCSMKRESRNRKKASIAASRREIG
jgi:hypothetical protein